MCQLHYFVFPSFDDYLICGDWQTKLIEHRSNPFNGQLKPGYLYRWNRYTGVYPPKTVARFEELKLLRLDRCMELVQHIDYGWVIYVPKGGEYLFPQPEQIFKISLNEERIPFVVLSIDMTTQYAPNGTDEIKNSESRLLIAPTISSIDKLAIWVKEKFDLQKEKNYIEERVLDPKYKNKCDKIKLFVHNGVRSPSQVRH